MRQRRGELFWSPWRTSTASPIAASIVALAACTGHLTDPGGSPPSRPGNDPMDPGSIDDACSDLSEPYLRRLTNAEYSRSLNELFGTDADYAAALPPDAVSTQGFDNNVIINLISETHAEKYRDIAEALSASVLADEAARSNLFGCDSTDPACLRGFVASFGRRVYRRPLSDDEVSRLVAVSETAASDPDPLTGEALILQAMLNSPSFLLRIEVGEPVPEYPGLLKLTDYEMASRLSYTLLGTTPDEELLDRAERGELDSADQVREVARTMLSDPRALEVIRAFVSQWMQLKALDGIDRDTDEYPLWSAALAQSMREGALRLVDDFAHGDAGFLGVFAAPYAYVDSELARVYGVEPPASGWERVTLPPEAGRAGILTSPGLLTVSGHDEGTMAITRGKLVRQRLLCDELPDPPDIVPELPAPDPSESERERLAQHRDDPACSGCHQLMDPIGFGLSRFDLVGRERSEDVSGHPIDGSGVLDDVEFEGAGGLADALIASPKVSSCVVRQVFRFVQGRSDVDADRCVLDQTATSFAGSGSFDELLLDVVSSDAFRYRRRSP